LDILHGHAGQVSHADLPLSAAPHCFPSDNMPQLYEISFHDFSRFDGMVNLAAEQALAYAVSHNEIGPPENGCIQCIKDSCGAESSQPPHNPQ
jgi:hypothetical protein